MGRRFQALTGGEEMGRTGRAMSPVAHTATATLVLRVGPIPSIHNLPG